jgi:hypothetical protein
VTQETILFTQPMRQLVRFTIAAAALVLLLGISWIFCSSRADGKFPHLRVFRQSVEQGEPVVYFRVETQRKFQMTNIERVMGETSDNPYQFTNFGSPGFWAPSQQWPLGGDRFARNGFGVLAPTNTVWKLRVEVMLETGSPIQKVKGMPSAFRFERGMGRSVLTACKNALESFCITHREWVESKPITNSVSGR